MMTSLPEIAASGDAALWLTISELAARRGVGAPAISMRVAALEQDGRVQTRKGRGRRKLVNLVQFLAAIGESGDAAREMLSETREVAPESDVAASPSYRDAQIRKAQAEAALREYDLRQKQGALVEIAELGPAAEACAEAIVAAIERLPAHAAEMAAGVGHDGERGARAQYRQDARHLRTTIVAAFDRMLATFPALAGRTLSMEEEIAPARGDLDPADR
jgi:DNA-binding MarR family transcriptional regulator